MSGLLDGQDGSVLGSFMRSPNGGTVRTRPDQMHHGITTLAGTESERKRARKTVRFSPSAKMGSSSWSPSAPYVHHPYDGSEPSSPPRSAQVRLSLARKPPKSPGKSLLLRQMRELRVGVRANELSQIAPLTFGDDADDDDEEEQVRPQNVYSMLHAAHELMWDTGSANGDW
jgi:hypothetical protein